MTAAALHRLALILAVFFPRIGASLLLLRLRELAARLMRRRPALRAAS